MVLDICTRVLEDGPHGVAAATDGVAMHFDPADSVILAYAGLD